MTTVFAYAFAVDLTLEQLFARLNQAGPWRWTMRDSEHWGDYISTRVVPAPDDAMVKIYVEPDHYVVNASFESEHPDATAKLQELRSTLLEKVLPALGARDVTPAETYD